MAFRDAIYGTVEIIAVPQPESNPPVAPATERVNPKTLLADLESRQDELLRLLDELEERTRLAIAQLSPAATGKPNVAPGTPAKEASPPQRDAKAA